MLDVLGYVISGAVLGFLIGLTGVGGGVLTVPVLILIMGLEPIEAVGTAGLFAVLTKVYAGIKHYRQGTINIKVGLKFLAYTLPGVIVASLLVKWGKASLSPHGVDALQAAVSYVIIGAISFALPALLFDYAKVKGYFLYTPAGQILRVLSLFSIGAIIGMTSVGGGILIIPALLVFYREVSRYVGTSIFVGLLSLVAMSCIYAFVGHGAGHGGDVNFTVAALMAIGSLVGTHCGSSLSKKIEPRRLQFVVMAVMILAAIMMILDKLL